MPYTIEELMEFIEEPETLLDIQQTRYIEAGWGLSGMTTARMEYAIPMAVQETLDKMEEFVAEHAGTATIWVNINDKDSNQRVGMLTRVRNGSKWGELLFYFSAETRKAINAFNDSQK